MSLLTTNNRFKRMRPKTITVGKSTKVVFFVRRHFSGHYLLSSVIGCERQFICRGVDAKSGNYQFSLSDDSAIVLSISPATLVAKGVILEHITN